MSTLNPESSPLPSLRRSPSSDLVPPSPAKKPKPNSPEKHDSGISGRKHRPERKHRCGITDAFLEKLFDEEATNYWDDEEKLDGSGPHEVRPVYPEPIPLPHEARPVYPEPLPRGYAWGSYMSGFDIKKIAYRMICAHCGKIGDHMTDECLYKDSEEAKEYRKQCEESRKLLAAYLKARRSSNHETKPDNK